MLGAILGNTILTKQGRQFLYIASAIVPHAFLQQDLWALKGRARHFQSQIGMLEICYALCQCLLFSWLAFELCS